MSRQSVYLRNADPTMKDGLVFARLMNEASEGFFRFMLGKESDRIMATAFLQANHDLSYEHVTFAEIKGIATGMFSGFTAKQHQASSRDVLYQAAGTKRMKMRIVEFCFAPIFRIIDSMADDDFYLQGIAVNKERRTEGIGSILMDGVENTARKSGARRLSLDVSANNINAIRFYRQRGMVIESKWPKRLFIPGFMFYRMVKLI